MLGGYQFSLIFANFSFLNDLQEVGWILNLFLVFLNCNIHQEYQIKKKNQNMDFTFLNIL